MGLAGSMLAAAAGVLVALQNPRIEPYMGIMPGLKAFVAAEPARRARIFARLTECARGIAELAARTGRRYSLVDYSGAADAERVLVLMGSGCEAAAEAVRKNPDLTKFKVE